MKSRSKELLDRAIAATVAAIEIYNKPNFLYREETFSILAVNGWELLIKAKWLKENNNKIRSLYKKEPHQNKDGSRSRKKRIKHTRSRNPITLSLRHLTIKLVEQKHLNPNVQKNIDALLELCNSSVHLYDQSKEFAIKIQEIGAASVRNFALLVEEWFGRDLSEFNLCLIPLSFVTLPTQTKAVVLNKEQKNFLHYLEQLESNSNKADSKYSVTVNIPMKFNRSKSEDASDVRITSNPNALEVRLTEENIREKYPWDYNKLTTVCQTRYRDFKCNNQYHKVRKDLHENSRFVFTRRLDPNNPKSSKKNFYNPSILQELDKHYSKQ